jgi:uncharacterized membrane protein YdjX (TVP38/TMEM64 family)
VVRYFPSLLIRFDRMLSEHQHNLFFYMTFMRVAPVMPSFFINYASPIVGVPISTFAKATLIGLIPVNYIHIEAGVTLATM